MKATVKIELEMEEGQHFPATPLTGDKSSDLMGIEEEARLSFVAWLDTFFNETSQGELFDWVQVKLHE